MDPRRLRRLRPTARRRPFRKPLRALRRRFRCAGIGRRRPRRRRAPRGNTGAGAGGGRARSERAARPRFQEFLPEEKGAVGVRGRRGGGVCRPVARVGRRVGVRAAPRPGSSAARRGRRTGGRVPPVPLQGRGTPVAPGRGGARRETGARPGGRRGREFRPASPQPHPVRQPQLENFCDARRDRGGPERVAPHERPPAAGARAGLPPGR
mmetsp:Transcript_34572/g.68052  ORF Transcript_34572/g.68052 Transcript_34572/m.68052 type:complete len:209 (-) Transcript_34572:234-860(-)